jgi:hypothetical protein
MAQITRLKSVIAVELAPDFAHPIDRFEIRPQPGRVHRAVRDEQRVVETADLKREELGRGWGIRWAGISLTRLRMRFSERCSRAAISGDRNAAIEQADDPRLTLGPVQASRSPRRN